MRVLASLFLAFFISVAASAASLAQIPTNLVTEEFMVPTKDDGISLYIRNKRPKDMTQFSPARTVLFVHGATYPSEVAFDLQVGGMSWMDYIASRGFDVYLLDLRGYGRSSRPKEMDQPADANGPIVDTKVAIGDIATGVDFILERRKIPRLNLIGWSWGTTTTAGYTADNPGKVRHLALYAPVWIGQPARTERTKLGAYRTVQKPAAYDRWLRGVPEDKKADLIPAGWFDAWWTATAASDPVGAAQNPPVLRAPNGVMEDIQNGWLMGKTFYDPARITVPTIIIVAEWDKDTESYMAQTLFPLLKNAPQKRLVMIGEGTHTVILEKNRMALFTAVQSFFEEGEPTQ
jgi:pimeloyl-ACP methyl ester carboxylesterase